MPMKAPESAKRPIGYARCSTVEQNPEMQIAALKAYGVDEKLIFVDRAKSGGGAKRPEFEKAMRMALNAGTELVVWKLDRLGRTLTGILDTMEMLDRNGVAFVSLTERFETGTPMGKAMIRLLAVVAELERDLTLERTRAGMKRKKERGEPVGRKPTMTPPRVAKAIEMRDEGHIGPDIWRAVRALPGPPMSKAAYYLWQKKYDEQKRLSRLDRLAKGEADAKADELN
jgi:DNA invertase Pin-like site-specific DNA recombinase